MQYIKEFEKWNRVKQSLEAEDRSITFNEKEIWWCSVGVNLGSEHDGKGESFIRPVYILRKINSRVFLGIPITSKLIHDYAHVAFYVNYDFSTAVVSQMRTFDKKRLLKKIGNTSDYLYEKIRKAAIAFIAM